MFNNQVLDFSAALSADGNGPAVKAKGGRYVLQASGTFGGGTVALQVLLPDNATWANAGPQNGQATSFTAAGSCAVNLLPGQYRVALTGSTAPAVQYAFGEANP